MKCKDLSLVLIFCWIILMQTAYILVATSLVSGCSAHKAGTGFGKTVKVSRQRALFVPPGPEIKPVKIDEVGHKYYDLNGNGIIDCYIETEDFRAFNYLEDVLGNKMGFGWETEQMARGVKFFGDLIDTVIEDAPENVWSGNLYTELEEHEDISTGKKITLTDEMKERVMKEYLRKSPHASLGPKWIVEYGNNQRLYYPLKDYVEGPAELPITMSDWEKIKAKGPVLIEYW